MKTYMNPIPCRRCRAEAMVMPTATGWTVECTVCGSRNAPGAAQSRDKAVKEWNERQKGEEEKYDPQK